MIVEIIFPNSHTDLFPLNLFRCIAQVIIFDDITLTHYSMEAQYVSLQVLVTFYISIHSHA